MKPPLHMITHLRLRDKMDESLAWDYMRRAGFERGGSRRPVLVRVAEFLRNQLRRIYGPGPAGELAADLAEPPWLRAFWQWCGIPYISPLKFKPSPCSLLTSRALEKDPAGTWWCTSTYADYDMPGYVHKLTRQLSIDMGVPPEMFISKNLTIQAVGRALREPRAKIKFIELP